MKLFRAWTFQWWEMGLLKVCLISLGILLGLYLRTYLVGFTVLWWSLFVAVAAYFIVKIFHEETARDVSM